MDGVQQFEQAMTRLLEGVEEQRAAVVTGQPSRIQARLPILLTAPVGDRVRRAVADNRSGRQLEQIVSKLRQSGITVDAHDVLKTAPKGYPKDHPRIELLRYKGLISWKQWPVGAWLGTRKAKDRLVSFLRASKPLHDWLEKRVGPSELAEER